MNLYVIPAVGGEARKLTDQKESVEEIAWSPDSKRIAFGARVRDEAYEEEDDKKRAPRRFTRVFHKLDSVGFTGDRRKHLFVVDLDGDEPKQLTSGDFEHANAAWSPDGKRIVFDGLRDERWDVELVNRLYSVDVDGKNEPKALTGDDASYGEPSFSPDGRRIAYRMTPEDGTYPHHSQIGVMNADGSDAKLLTTSLDRQCGPYPDYREPVWDGERIVFTVEDGGNLHIYAVAADGSSAPERVVGGEQVISAFDVRDGKLAYVASTHTTLRELYIGTDGRRVTHVGGDFEHGRALAERRTLHGNLERRLRGRRVDRPACRLRKRARPTRALLNIHGGPFSQYGTGFFDENQVYAGGGYVVLFSNPRGGSGYSEEHGRAIRGPLNNAGPGWGTRDYEDVMAVVDTALEKFDFIDPERLGVIGGSYGGFMTSWIIGHTNRFKAAVSERAVNNLVSMFGSSDLFWVFERQFGGPMWENVDAYLDRSPSTYAQQMEHTGPRAALASRTCAATSSRVSICSRCCACSARTSRWCGSLRRATSCHVAARRSTASCASRRSSSTSGVTSRRAADRYQLSQ